MSDETHTFKRQKHRSPSYPAFDLETALKRAKELHDVAGRHPAPVSAVLNTWGYSPKSSAGLLTIAALKKFGLADDEGKLEARTLRLTELGYELVFYGSDRESDAWKERAQMAAMLPAIHRDLWAKYSGDLPHDSIVLPHLVVDLKFSESAANEVLKEFRRTLEFAQMKPGEGGDTVVDEQEDDHADDIEEIVPPVTLEKPAGSQNPPAGTGEKPAALRTIQVTYHPDRWALLQAAFPMSESDWDAMIGVLQAMKPGLVKSD